MYLLKGKIEFPATKVEWWDLKSDTMQHVQIPATSFEALSDGKAAASAAVANVLGDGNKVAASESTTKTKENNAPKSIWFTLRWQLVLCG